MIKAVLINFLYLIFIVIDLQLQCAGEWVKIGRKVLKRKPRVQLGKHVITEYNLFFAHRKFKLLVTVVRLKNNPCKVQICLAPEFCSVVIHGRKSFHQITALFQKCYFAL